MQRRAPVAERLLRTMTILLVLGNGRVGICGQLRGYQRLGGVHRRVLTGAWLVCAVAGRYLDRRRHPGGLVALASRVWRRICPHPGSHRDGGSLALNVAHAPDHADARLVAALPPLALLAAVELVMSEARRALAHPSSPSRVDAAPADATAVSAAFLGASADGMAEHAAALAASGSVVRGAVDAGDTRTRVRAPLAGEQAGGPRLTGKQVAAVVGIKPRRAQKLLRELRAEVAAMTIPSQDLCPLAAGDVDP